MVCAVWYVRYLYMWVACFELHQTHMGNSVKVSKEPQLDSPEEVHQTHLRNSAIHHGTVFSYTWTQA